MRGVPFVIVAIAMLAGAPALAQKPPLAIDDPSLTKKPEFDAERSTRPSYPTQARRAGHSGETKVTLCVDETGRISNVALSKSSGSDLLDETTLAWAQDGLAMTPAEVDGVAVAVCDYTFTNVWNLEEVRDGAYPTFNFPMPVTYPRADSLPESDRPRMLTRPPAPPYPAAALAARKEGTVTLAVCIKEDGSIGAVSPLNTAGSDDLTVMTLFWISQAKFAPAKKDGKPIAVCAFEVAYDWKLPE